MIDAGGISKRMLAKRAAGGLPPIPAGMGPGATAAAAYLDRNAANLAAKPATKSMAGKALRGLLGLARAHPVIALSAGGTAAAYKPGSHFYRKGPGWWRTFNRFTSQPVADFIVGVGTGTPWSELNAHDTYRQQVNAADRDEYLGGEHIPFLGITPAARSHNKARLQAEADIKAKLADPTTAANQAARALAREEAMQSATSETNDRARAIAGGIVVGLLGLGAGAAYLDRRNVRRLQEQRRSGSGAVLRSLHAVNELDRAERQAGAPAL